MSSTTATMICLTGSQNYKMWAFKMKAILIKLGLGEVTKTNDVSPDINERALAEIHLTLEMGPSMQVCHLQSAHQTLETIKCLYSPQGYSMDYFVIVDFLKCKLSNFNTMEEYVNSIKHSMMEMEQRDVLLPKKFIITFILEGLTSKYDMVAGNIRASLKSDLSGYDYETLFSSLLDESRRLGMREQSSEVALHASLRGHNNQNPQFKRKNAYKIQKGKYCRHCKMTNHNTTDCSVLRKLRNRSANQNHKRNNDPSQDEDSKSSTGENVMHTSITENEVVDFNNIDMDLELNFDQVFTTTQFDITQAKSTQGKFNPVTYIMLLNGINSEKFILDTGATSHIICKREYFTSFNVCTKTVKWGNAKSININGIGDVQVIFKNNNKKHQLKDCLYMPELGVNLISQSKMRDDYVSIFTKNNVVIKYQDDVIACGHKINNLYYIDIDRVLMPNQLLHLRNSTKKIQTEKRIELTDLHAKMGHISLNSINKLIENTTGYDCIDSASSKNLDSCEICLRGKFTNQINKVTNHKSFDYLEKISSDICGPIAPVTHDNYKYFITFMDIYSRYLEVKLLRSKDEAVDAFSAYASLYENNSKGKRIRIFATDNGTEYTNKRIKTILENKGITHQLSPVYTKEPNGIIERVNRTLTNKVRCLLANSNLPKTLWGEACLAATYLYNRTPHSSINFKTPYERKYGAKPDISNIKTFGSICYYKNKGSSLTKLDDKAIKGVLVGFHENLYKVYNTQTKKCFWVRDIHILDNNFVTSDDSTTETKPEHIKIDTFVPNMRDVSHTRAGQMQLSSQTNFNLSPGNACKPQKTIHQTQAQAADQLYDDDIDELALLANFNNEPNTYKQATSCPDSEQWQQAMQKEIDELERQQTWSITELPKGKSPLKGRWVYKLKTDLNGNIIKYKARWVVKGFSQILGIDFLDTFSTTCRPESYRIIFILAMHKGWALNQYDVKNAFIHASIDHEIFVEQPLGFERNLSNKSTAKGFCKLNKALYGLKQSPRLWYEHLLGILKNHGFEAMPYDSAVFVHTNEKIIILCHVDDLIITGPNLRSIHEIITELEKSITLEKIGNINQFLGMQVTTDYKNKCIQLNQNKYTASLLERFDKQTVRPVTSPVELGINLEKSQEEPSNENIRKYQQQVGSLIYLAINTRPDISFAVNRCARYMAKPNETHFRALDRIWKYLAKFPEFGLYYDCKSVGEHILGYTDADWGGDTVSRKSTSGYIFLLNGNIISWLSMQQKTVALSSCEAEYMALKEAIKESIYLNNLLSFYNKFLELKISKEIPKLLTDSESALKLAENPEFHKRSKHIDITYHFIRDSIKTNKVKLFHVGTKNQLADGFTKGLDTLKHKSFLQSLNLT